MFGFIKNFLYGLMRIDKVEYSYNDRLIKTLENQHKDLFKSYNNIYNLAKKGKIEKVIEELDHLKRMYTTHILIEDNKLYTYLEKTYKESEPDIYNFVLNKQNEIKTITNNLIKFIEKYSNEETLENEIDIFIKEWEKLGILLNERITMEQNQLYPLYKNIKKN